MDSFILVFYKLESVLVSLLLLLAADAWKVQFYFVFGSVIFKSTPFFFCFNAQHCWFGYHICLFSCRPVIRLYWLFRMSPVFQITIFQAISPLCRLLSSAKAQSLMLRLLVYLDTGDWEGILRDRDLGLLRQRLLLYYIATISSSLED